MITLLILIGAFLVYMCVCEARWGTLAVVIVIGLILIIGAAGERKDYEAWRNMRDYWAKGGPDRKK